MTAKTTVFDLVSQGATWVVGSSNSGGSTGLPSIIKKVSDFSDSLTFEKCSQFADQGLDFIGIGDCNPNVQTTLGKYLKNNSATRFLNKFTDAYGKIKNTIDNTIESVKENFQKSYYCTTLAPMFNILVNLLEQLIEKPKMILAMIYRYLEKILDIIKNLVNRLFSCFESAINRFKSLLDGIKVPDFLNFLKGITIWSERCEVIAGPIVSMFNNLVKDSTIRSMLVSLGTIQDINQEIRFESIQEVNAFLQISLNFADKLNNEKDKLLNKVYDSSLVKNAVYGYQMVKAYTQYGVAIVTQKILSPILKLASAYNNMLHARSRYLGIVVNHAIGWVFPPKGYKHNYEDNIIYRAKYSIVDVLIICDSLNDCNDYLCGGIQNRIKQMFSELKLSRKCWWLNPFIDANQFMDKMINNLDVAYKNAFEPSQAIEDRITTYFDVEFIKSIRSFSNSPYQVQMSTPGLSN